MGVINLLFLFSLPISFAQFVPNSAPIFSPEASVIESNVAAPVINPIQQIFPLPIGPLLIPGLPPFTSAFLQNVAQSEILSQALSRIFRDPLTGKIFFNPVLNVVQNLPLEGIDAPTVAQYVANGFERAASVITPPLFVLAVGSALERLLTEQGYMTKSNVETLARQYINILESSVRVLEPTATQEQVLTAVTDGTLRFLNALNLPYSTSPLTTTYFTQAFNALPRWVSRMTQSG